MILVENTDVAGPVDVAVAAVGDAAVVVAVAGAVVGLAVVAAAFSAGPQMGILVTKPIRSLPGTKQTRNRWSTRVREGSGRSRRRRESEIVVIAVCFRISPQRLNRDPRYVQIRAVKLPDYDFWISLVLQ